MTGDLSKRGVYAAGDQETRDWFERQFRIWPRRAHPDMTTDLELHYWGLVSYRTIHGHEPKMSRDFATAVKFFDSAYGNTPLAPRRINHIVVAQPMTKRQRRRQKGKK